MIFPSTSPCVAAPFHSREIRAELAAKGGFFPDIVQECKQVRWLRYAADRLSCLSRFARVVVLFCESKLVKQALGEYELE